MRMMSACTFFLIFLLLFLAGVCAANLLGPKGFRLEVQEISDAGAAGGFIHGPGDYGRTITVDNRKRYYEIHVPAAYDKSAAVPLVLVFHGGGSDQGIIRFESQMDTTSDREGFITIYPAGTNRRLLLKNRILFWNDGRPYQDGTFSEVDDIKFIEMLLVDVQKMFKVDSRKIYACGYSNGAQFSFQVAKQLSDRIAAMAAVAGQRSVDEHFPPPGRPLAVMQFAGLQDTIAPYAGGVPHFEAELKADIKPVPETIRSWVEFNGCSSSPEVNRIGKAVMNRYGGCRGGAEVVLWTLEDGGHTWPGGNVIAAAEKFGLGNINRDINASDLMWDFFKRHPLQ